MKKFLFLSSAFIMTTLGAFGADGTITGGANTCTVDVLGVSENNATANTIATWSLIDYECPAGQYLLNSDGTLKCTECPVGSYCPGGKYTVESENNGANTCPTDYTSDTGAVGENECYIGCELACTQQTCPEHSENCTHGVSSTNGKQYVGGTCNAEKTFCSIDFECAPGYNKIIANSEYLFDTLGGGLHSNIIFSCDLNNNSEQTEILSQIGINSDACNFLSPGTFMTGSLKIQVLYNDYDINNSDVIHKTYTDDEERTFIYTYNTNMPTNLLGDNIWVKPINAFIPTPIRNLIENIRTPYSDTDLNWKQLRSSLSEKDFEYIQKLIGSGTEEVPEKISAEMLWSIQTMGTVEIPVTYPWIYVGHRRTDSTSNEDAIHNSAYYYGTSGRFFEPYRLSQNLLSIFLPDNGATYCMSNAININWNPDNGTDALQSMCMYNNGLAVPDDPVKPGYTFTGWKLVE